MKTLLALSCLLVFILPNESQFVIPSLTGEIKKIASHLGIHSKPSSSPPPLGEIHPQQPALDQTHQGQADHSLHKPQNTKDPHVNNIDSNSVHSDHGGANTVPSSHPIKQQGEANTENKKSKKPVQNLNNVTAINRDGTVVFPDEEYNPNAVKINKTVDCQPGVQYPPNHPCGKLLTGAAKDCPPGTAGNDCISTSL